MYALLPMKHHSERVKNKNYRLLGNKPFFFHIADALNKSGLFKKLIINTDSEKIRKLAEDHYGEWVIVLDRPKELMGDHVPMNNIIQYDIMKIGLENHYIQTHSTSPFLSADTIKKAVSSYQSSLEAGTFDSLFSVNALQSRLYNSMLQPINHDPSNLVRTQDLNTIYEENSGFYCFSGISFQSNSHRIGKKPNIFIMARNSIESIDVDNMDDWRFAERIYKANASKHE